MENVLIILSLVLIEGLLSIDNALVLAVLVRVLPDKKLQKRALMWGIWGAFIFRFIGLIVASHLIKLRVFQLLGGLYLVYIAFKHFYDFGRKKHECPIQKKVSAASFWKVVVIVELTDIAFSIDSIIAAVALSREVWVVYTGAVLGIITMRMVAGVFIRVIDKYPAFYHTGYIMVAWVGFKLLIEFLNHQYKFPMLPKWIFWVVMGIVFVSSFYIKLNTPGKNDELIAQAEQKLENLDKNNE